MKFYHFTAKEYLPRILASGLSRGDVPKTPKKSKNAVWLTTDIDASGHGLSEARELTYVEKLLSGIPPEEPARFPDKRAIRIEVDIDLNDPALRKWDRWATANNVPRSWRRRLESLGGGRGKAVTWWLYFGTIPSERLVAYDIPTGLLLHDCISTPLLPEAA
ncbi:hypothetical protein [Phenylobacterium montanum]|uniref:Uncharacterized protein n=1 Tax=Phenylobacterium montanum TaxID=2823693 RepID=A0A975IXF5_9CAUL|nr:hypothetical protein [Caulobacter sp. S6]QUD90584.1 hypothetical protein KCG34_12285 [Caulobacter sp. S6]